MATVGIDDGSLQADSQPKSEAWQLLGAQFAFIEWTEWTLAVVLP